MIMSFGGRFHNAHQTAPPANYIPAIPNVNQIYSPGYNGATAQMQTAQMQTAQMQTATGSSSVINVVQTDTVCIMNIGSA